jgi:ammonium transporter Rh
VGVLFALCYQLVEFVVISGDALTGVVDPGGAICVHMFAAYWGIGVALVLRERRLVTAEYKWTTHSIGLVWIATTTLWLFWPSFVTLYYLGDVAVRAQVACIMGGAGSIVSEFLTESMLKKGVVNTVVFAYAMLGGCVGVSSAVFIVGPWGALLIGLICGVLSDLSFNFLDPLVPNILGIKDVMGVHNLHGVSGWASVICGSIGCRVKGFEGGWTFAGALIAVVMALALGAISGIALRFLNCAPVADENLLCDRAFFEFPDDGGDEPRP